MVPFWRSCDLINVVFGKIAITPSLFNLKTSNQNLKKSNQNIVSGQPNTKLSKYLCRNWQKKALNTVTIVVAKILTCYISVTVPDRPMITIIYR